MECTGLITSAGSKHSQPLMLSVTTPCMDAVLAWQTPTSFSEGSEISVDGVHTPPYQANARDIERENWIFLLSWMPWKTDRKGEGWTHPLCSLLFSLWIQNPSATGHTTTHRRTFLPLPGIATRKANLSQGILKDLFQLKVLPSGGRRWGSVPSPLFLDRAPWVNFYSLSLFCLPAKLFTVGKTARIIHFLKIHYI